MQDTLTAQPSPRRPGIQAIARAARVLRALAAAPGGSSLAELSEAVGLPKSTVHRLVAALASEDLLAHAADGGILLGPGIARLGAAAADAIVPLLHPLLEDLAAELGETVDLAALHGQTVRFLDQVPGSHRLRAVSSIGAEFPAHCTANGKALLAELPEASLVSLLPVRLKRMTPATIVSRDLLLEELSSIRGAGVAYDRQEHSEGICAVGAVVRGPTGAVGSITVPVPATRFEQHERQYAEAVAATAASASEMLAARREIG